MTTSAIHDARDSHARRRSAIPVGHSVQFHDESRYPATEIADYLVAGMNARAGVVAVATAPHLAEIRRALSKIDIDVEAAAAAGTLVLLDADETLAAMHVDRELSDAAFEAVVGGCIRGLFARFGSVRAFGEMVDVLCRHGRAHAALELEGLWSRLRRERDFDLLCGYSLTSFGDADAGERFRSVCSEHGDVHVVDAIEASWDMDRPRLVAHLEQRRHALRVEMERRRQLEAERAQRFVDERFLAQAGRLLATSLDFGTTLEHVASLAVPACADLCFVDLLDEDGATFDRVAIGHHRPEHADSTAALKRRHPFRPDDPYGSTRALVELRPQLLRELDQDALRAVARDGDCVETLLSLAVRSSVSAPLVARGRAIGVLTLLACDRNFTEHELWLAEQLAWSAAAAIENARLYALSQQAAQRAETANRIKDEFLATVSHELRSPLNAITGWVQLALSGMLSDERKHHALEVIQRSAHAQERLISDLLDMSRVISGRLRLSVERVDLVRVLGLAVETVKPMADAKGVHLDLRFDEIGENVLGDADRLQQVVWNLLTNAVKFTNAGGTVELGLALDLPNAVVTVRDQGQGIRADFLPHIFEAFRQGDASFARKHRGLGLGLAISRMLVELHGGTIEAASQGDGRGATFTIKLPLEALRPEATPRVPTLARPIASPTVSARTALAGVRVLVVEDEPDSREMILSLLEQHGATTYCAASAVDAMEQLKHARPHVVLSDVGLPSEDGLSLMRRLRGLPEGSRFAAAALTAFVQDGDRDRALEAGFDAHVPKPIEPDRLVEVIARLAALRR